MAPVLSSSQQVNSAGSDLTSLVSSAITVTLNDVIVVKVMAENGTGPTIGTPTATGQTFVSRASQQVNGNCGGAIYTTIAAAGGTMTITVPYSITAGWHSVVFERWTNAVLATTPATNATKTGAGIGPSTTLTTAAANSVITLLDGDWAANAPGTPAYRGSSPVQDGLHDKSTANYVAYYWYAQAASAGSQTIGLTTPGTSQTWTMLGIEVQDGGGAALGLPELTMAPRWSGVNYG